MPSQEDSKSDLAYGDHCEEAFKLFDTLRAERLIDMAKNTAVVDFDSESIEATADWLFNTFSNWVKERAVAEGVHDALVLLRESDILADNEI